MCVVGDPIGGVSGAIGVVGARRSSDTGSDVDESIETVAGSGSGASRGGSRSSRPLDRVDDVGRPDEIIAFIAAVRAAVGARSAFTVAGAADKSSRRAASVVVSSLGAAVRRAGASRRTHHEGGGASSASGDGAISSRSPCTSSRRPSTSSCPRLPSAVADLFHMASARPHRAAP
jgi:hypothetical protein